MDCFLVFVHMLRISEYCLIHDHRYDGYGRLFPMLIIHRVLQCFENIRMVLIHYLRHFLEWHNTLLRCLDNFPGFAGIPGQGQDVPGIRLRCFF